MVILLSVVCLLTTEAEELTAYSIKLRANS